MSRVIFFLAVLLVGVSSPPTGKQMPAHSGVEMAGVSATLKFEVALEGFLAPLNGKVKQRATQVAFEPGGKLGDHLHVGPGIRLVQAGELTVVDGETGSEQRFPAGAYFYETGDKSFRVENRTAQPAQLLVVEILPAGWQGSAAVPLARRGELEEQGRALAGQLCAGR